MKVIPFLLGLLLTASLLKAMEPVPAPGEPAAPSGKSSGLVRVQVEFIELPHETLTELLFLSEPASSNATELRKKVQDLVRKKEATVIETQIVTGRDGEKASTESIQEKIYPTEYEPPELPGSFGPRTLTPQTSPVPQVDPAPIVATPTAFDTRNCGNTLEVEPILLDEGKLIRLHLVPEMVWHTGNTVWQDLKDGLGNLSNIQMPDFYSLRLNTTITCPNRQYVLAAALSPKNDKGEVDSSRKVMVFVKCEVLAPE